MRRINVVTEGTNDAELLKLLLVPVLGGTQIHVWGGQGWSEAESLASSILAVKHEPVVLVGGREFAR